MAQISFSGKRLLQEDVGGGEDAAHRLDRGGRERDLRSLPVDGQLLDDLGRVAVAGRLEGAHGAAAFGVMRAESGRAARAGRSGLRLDDDRAREIDDLGLEEGVETEDAGGGHAAGAGDQIGVADLLAVQLGYAVDERSQQLRVLVLVAVPLRVVGGIAQPEVGAEVDDDRRLLAQLGHLPHGDAVRQRAEDDVGRLQVGERRELEVGSLAQVGMDRTDELAGVPLRGDLLDRDLGMIEQQADQLAAGVAAAANNRNVHR